jgi:hypothetical protein
MASPATAQPPSSPPAFSLALDPWAAIPVVGDEGGDPMGVTPVEGEQDAGETLELRSPAARGRRRPLEPLLSARHRAFVHSLPSRRYLMKRRLPGTAFLVMLSALVIVVCQVQTLDVAAAVGAWSGTWSNTTFASSGSAAMTVTQDSTAKTVTMTVDLGGNVFGMGDPAAQVIDASYTNTQATASTSTALFGAITMSVGPTGAISGTAHPASFDHLTFTGTLAATTLSLDFTIYDTPTNVFAVGTVSMTKP